MDVENLQTSVGHETPTLRTRIEVIGVFAQIWALDGVGLFDLDIIYGLVIIIILSLKMDLNRKVSPHCRREALTKAFLFLSCPLAAVQLLTASKFTL